MIYRMKVTALLPDPLIKKVQHFSKGKNITDALVIALSDWVAQKKILELNAKVESDPLKFRKGFSAQKGRFLNRIAS